MYVCNNCGYSSDRYFGLCPKCKDGVGELVDIPVQTNKNANTSKLFDISNIKRVDYNEQKIVASRSTQYQNFNQLISSVNGFIDGQVVLLAASPGVGKSTLCTAISDNKTLYISSEESYSQVNQRFLRINKDANSYILASTDIDEILQAIRLTDANLVIIDSLNSIDFGVGYARTAKYAYDITQTLKETGKVGIIISQVAKTGEILGMNTIVHVVDTVIFLERSSVSNDIVATSSKNRFGVVGDIAIFQHTEDGFKEIDVLNELSEPETGITYSEVKFGHKNMTVAIESLVSRAQSSYGLRKANGYNQNRLYQIIGVLTANLGLDLNSYDIYIALSNGLYSDDIKLDLTIANSILSSYHKKNNILKASGEIMLNGRIRNGLVDGEPIKSINDLLNYYK